MTSQGKSQLALNTWRYSKSFHVRWLPCHNAWCVLGFQMEGSSSDMDGSCKYIE